MRRSWKYSISVLCALIAVNGFQSPANATTIIVTNGDDSGSGSLRSAIASSSDGDSISFADGVKTVTLTSGKLEVGKGISILGSAQQVVTISRSASAITNFPIFVITPTQNTTVNLEYLDIANGTEGGVGINSTGGSIVTIRHSTIRDNDRSWGSGIYAVSGTAGPGSLFVDSTTITGNTTNGGATCGFCNGAGGIIEIPSIFVNSTIAYNRSGDNGGGIKVDSIIKFYNTTIAYNSANGLGAGIWETRFNNWPELTLVNTIVAKNTIGTTSGAAQCNTADGSNSFVVSENVNTLIEDGSCNFIRPVRNLSTSPATNFKSGDPLLGSFGFNNGVNKVFPLQIGSQAIGAGDSAVCSGLYVAGVDQQGTQRSGTCSIGAIELFGTPERKSTFPSDGLPIDKSLTETESKPAVKAKAKKLTIRFDKGSSTLTQPMKKSLKKFALNMEPNQKFIISVSAGTLTGFSQREVQNLSNQRAKTILRYLISIGLKKEQISKNVSLVSIRAIPKTRILAPSLG